MAPASRAISWANSWRRAISLLFMEDLGRLKKP
jgi:hypothetical protein